MMLKDRLDRILVARAFAPSRARARDVVMRGMVQVGENPATKPGQIVAYDADIVVHDPTLAYVSRAAFKLSTALDRFGINPAGALALDLGASTGGFAQVLLERGAAQVHAIDVGHGQLAEHIAADPRIVSHEGLNARNLTPAHLGGAQPTLIVVDVSFISLTLALPPALALASPGACLVALIKPQFEVGPAHIGKGGLVEKSVAAATGERVAAWLAEQANWQFDGLIPSPIAGGDGNHEWLMAGRKLVG